MKEHRTQTGQKRRIDFSQIEKLHPYKTFLFFALLGSTLVFMTVAFLYLSDLSKSLPDRPVRLPRPFFLSTLLLLFSSFAVARIKAAFEADSSKDYLLFSGLTVLAGMLFTACQVIGLIDLVRQGLPLSLENNYSFFYVASGIHFMHVLTGLVFVIILFIHGYRQSKDPVRSLLFFSNRFYLTRIELCAWFWHFVAFLWLGLFLVFLFTF